MRILLRKSVILVLLLSLLAIVGAALGLLGLGRIWLILPAACAFAIMVLVIIRFQQILEKNGVAERRARAYRDKSNESLASMIRRLNIMESNIIDGFSRISTSSDDFEAERQAYISFHLRETTTLLAGLSQSVSRIERHTQSPNDFISSQSSKNVLSPTVKDPSKQLSTAALPASAAGTPRLVLDLEATSLKEWHDNLCDWIGSVYSRSGSVMPRNFAGNTATLAEISLALQGESHIVDYGIDSSTFMLADQRRSEPLYIVESDPRLVSFVAQELGERCRAYASPSSVFDAVMEDASETASHSLAVVLCEPGQAELDSILSLTRRMNATDRLSVVVASRWKFDQNDFFAPIAGQLATVGLEKSGHKSFQFVQVWTKYPESTTHG